MGRSAALSASFALFVTAVLVAGTGAVPAVAGPATVPRVSSSSGTGTPGAPGAGDPYFPLDGNGGFDVSHYDIVDTYDFASGLLTGTTTLRATATQDLSRFDLDLVLDTDSVEVDGRAATFDSGPHELVITPASDIRQGDEFTVVVSYHGAPLRIGFHDEWPWYADKQEVMATNEPHIAPWWFAASDHPTDKATYDITVRVPAGNQVISNGTLVSHRDDADYTTWHWAEHSPMASYLAFFAAGHFQMESGRAYGYPYTLAVSERLSPRRRAADLFLMRRTPYLTWWLSKQFGTYPFESTGGVVTSLPRGFSLENQGRPTFPPMWLGRYWSLVVVHELAHQWFGDDVSVHRWSDIWLNEGFAEYVEWLYAETHGGKTGEEHLLHAYNSIPRGPFWGVMIGHPAPGNLFNWAVYLRGAMTLQALRNRIGYPAFMRLLRTWVHEHAGGDASIAQFESLARQISGQSLQVFFHNWLFDHHKPANTKINGLPG